MRVSTTHLSDIVFGKSVIVSVEVWEDGSIFADVWSLEQAYGVLADKQRIAAEYERDADMADREGRSDGPIFRASASELLTQAHDLFIALNRASGGLSDIGRRAA